jgi:hypothetical protein
MPNSFTGARIKTEWAKQHINQLDAIITAFSASGYFKLIPERDSETGQDGFKVEIVKKLPVDVALIMSDIIHNLRSALDIAMMEIFHGETGMYCEWLGFPIKKTRDDLVKAVNSGNVQKTPKAIRDYIVDGAKSYKDGNVVLWNLNHLNNCEKHMLLIPVASTGIFTIVSDAPEGGGKGSFIVTWFNINAGNTFIPVEGFTDFKIDKNFQPTLFVGIDPRGMAQGQQVIPMLVSFADCVSSILNDLERIWSA